MSRRPSVAARPTRSRLARGPFPVCYVFLVFVAIVWFPLGNSNGVSEVSAALRPVVHTSSAGAIASAAHNGDRRPSRAAVVMPAVLAGVTALAALRSSRRPAPEDHDLPLRLVAAALRSRAPPLTA